MNRRRSLIIVVLLLLVATTGGLVFFRSQSKETNTPRTVETLEVETGGLAPVIPQLPSISEDDINTALMGIIRMNFANPADTYDATYRKNSLERSQASTGAPIVSFLVDVPDLQRTYRIEIEGNDETPSKTIYALCPLPEQSAYGEKACNDTP
ncbi:MAG TPA: hypothetical protein VGE30_03745 [Candidatus Saccharimonadales bacterium]